MAGRRLADGYNERTMNDTYKAILHGDRREWSGEAPGHIHQDQPVAVRVTILDKTTPAGGDRGQRMAAALERLAASQALPDLADPVKWERESRMERPLPGRDG